MRNFSAMPTVRGESQGSAERKFERNRDSTFSFFPLQSEISFPVDSIFDTESMDTTREKSDTLVFYEN